ncbi:bacteriocin immunity protein [Lactobacillus intestinalis]|uniref:Bacteriocin immunity protein n=1 Tax=Lactobacillus intestinalis DSM 6629 TaxID=1423761 RepID=A0ABR5PQ71_9LACO|nr:bacteriocin immunity protein [Lactobacillus intestinalis]KRM32780.1 hypothetical protein FC44_GL001585 [Lactobacillus intestinalis DSM 6629]UTW41100.1 bacteriocin immunity protein [Lactobacillus intestinalis]
MAAIDEEYRIRNDIKNILYYDPEIKKNTELMNIFRIAYERRDAGKPMREVALALDKSLAAYITNHKEVPESVIRLHKNMMELSEIDH